MSQISGRGVFYKSKHCILFSRLGMCSGVTILNDLAAYDYASS